MIINFVTHIDANVVRAANAVTAGEDHAINGQLQGYGPPQFEAENGTRQREKVCRSSMVGQEASRGVMRQHRTGSKLEVR